MASDGIDSSFWPPPSPAVSTASAVSLERVRRVSALARSRKRLSTTVLVAASGSRASSRVAVDSINTRRPDSSNRQTSDLRCAASTRLGLRAVVVEAISGRARGHPSLPNK